MASRFDPYDDELWGCFCPLCMALAAEYQRGGGSCQQLSDELFDALEAGTHKHEGPHVSLVKHDPRTYRSDGHEMRYGMGIGMTPGGINQAQRKLRERNRNEVHPAPVASERTGEDTRAFPVDS